MRKSTGLRRYNDQMTAELGVRNVFNRGQEQTDPKRGDRRTTRACQNPPATTTSAMTRT
jgi:hypothetical protein